MTYGTQETIWLSTTANSDLDSLRRKYREERDRRLRPEANDQYVEVKGDFSHYVDDPHVEPGFIRAPLTEDVEVLVIGGGFGGLMAAARLREAGIEDIRIVEKGGGFGGAWYWNRYPGAQCDIESHIYLPLLEETGYIPREKYSTADEIREHAERIGKHYDLHRGALFQTEIRELRWIENDLRWLVTTSRSDTLMARFVVMSNGVLNRPKLPGIPGIDSYKGHTFHTSRWDYEYTGGGSQGNLDKLADKRIAIIGTGATAVGCIPHLGRSAQHLYVFQRTPSSVDVRIEEQTDPEWVRTLTPGWQKRRMDNFNILVNGGHQDEDLVNDGWTDIIRNLGLIFDTKPGESGLSPQEMDLQTEISDARKMNEIRARIEAIVEEPETAEALKPWYRQFCKRPCYSNEYLPTFNRPNVTLVDTKGRGVDRVMAEGLVFDGIEYEVDCIIFASGFEVGTSYTRRSGFEIYGRSGQSLTEYWKNGLRTLHGFYSHGFPNCFHMGLTQNTFTPNFVHGIWEQSAHIAEVISAAKVRQARTVEPSAAAEADWIEVIRGKAMVNLQFRIDCTPGYYNGEGRAADGKGLFDGLYPGPIEFYDIVRSWRTEQDMPGLEFR